MQRPDEQKRQLIIDTAGRLFAAQPFHKVRLDDVAAAAKLGKGTLYIYFESKEDLYFTLVYEGFTKLVDQLRDQLEAEVERPAAEQLRRIVAALVAFGFQNPHLFELVRTAGAVPGHTDARWKEKGKELQVLIEQTIRRGISRKELADVHPELTALCIPGMVRSVMLFGPRDVDEQTVTRQIVSLLTRGIVKDHTEVR
jgi:AcrR family transcriptional regulator